MIKNILAIVSEYQRGKDIFGWPMGGHKKPHLVSDNTTLHSGFSDQKIRFKSVHNIVLAMSLPVYLQ